MIDSGSCGSNGYKMLESKIECEQAAADLGLSDTSAFESQNDARPHGCIYADHVWLNWNSPETQYPSASCGSEEWGYAYNCICLKGEYSNDNRF